MKLGLPYAIPAKNIWYMIWLIIYFYLNIALIKYLVIVKN